MDEARQAARQFFGRNDVFAETVSHLFGIEEMRVDPEEIRDLEGMQFLEGGKPYHVPEERDLMRFWHRGGQGHLIIALDLAYQPVWPTEMRYRYALSYYDQLGMVYEDWAAAAAEIRQFPIIDGSYYLTEMLLHYPEGGKILPVFPFAVYLGEEPWDLPLTAFEMMSDLPKSFLEKLSDYKVNLLNPLTIEDDVCRQFQTELRYIVPMLKYRGSPEKLEAYFGADKPGALSPEALELLRTHGYPDGVPEIL